MQSTTKNVIFLSWVKSNQACGFAQLEPTLVKTLTFKKQWRGNNIEVTTNHSNFETVCGFRC